MDPMHCGSRRQAIAPGSTRSIDTVWPAVRAAVPSRVHTWCLLRSSADRGALISFRRSLEGAEK